MDIATLGVAIDPSDAQAGSRKAVQAAQQMAAGMQAAGDKFEREAKDAGRAAQKMGEDTKQGAGAAEAAVGKLARSPAFEQVKDRARMTGSAIRSSIVDAFNATGLLNNPLGNLVSRMDSMMRVGENVSQSIGGLGGRFAGLRGMVMPVVATLGLATAAVVGLGAATSTTFAAMRAAGPMQQMQQGLESLIGNAETAAAVIESLRATSRATGSDLGSNLDTTTKFIALGFSPANAVKLNSSIADIAGTLGMSAQRASELGNALAQVQSKGTVSMEELRQQIAEKGVPVFDVLAKKMNVTTAELTKMVEQGKVPAKQLVDIFLNLEGSFSKFAGGAARATQTLPGAVARLSANWSDLLREMGKPINDAVTPIINQLSNSLGSLRSTAASIGQMIASGITAAAPTVNSFFAFMSEKVRSLTAMQATGEFWKGWGINGLATIEQLIEQITAGFLATAKTFGEALIFGTQNVIESLTVLLQPAFWARMGSALYNIAVDFTDAMLKGTERVINGLLSSLPEWMGGGMKVTFTNPLEKIDTSQLPNATPLDLFDGNNQEWDTAQRLKDSFAATSAFIADGFDFWEGKANEWNETKLKPAAEKLADTFANPPLIPGGATTADPAEEVAKKAEAVKDRGRKAGQDTRTEFQKLMADWGNTAAQIDQINVGIAQSISANISDALTDVITGATSASEAFGRMAQSMIADLVRMATQMLINYAIQKAIGLAVGAIGGGTGAVAAAATTAAVAHTGGLVSDNMANSRAVPVAAFKGARKYQHGGTIPGVGSGETPAIMEPGEQVLTRDQAADIRGRLAGNQEAAAKQAPQAVTILNVVDPTLIEQHMAKNPGIVLNAIGAQASKVKRLLGVT